MRILVVTDDEMLRHRGVDLILWETLPPHLTLRLPRVAPIKSLQMELEKCTGIPVAHQEVWEFRKRKNMTWRPKQRVDLSKPHMAIDTVVPRLGRMPWRLYCTPATRTQAAGESIKLFAKAFDPVERKLRVCGSLRVRLQCPVTEVSHVHCCQLVAAVLDGAPVIPPAAMSWQKRCHHVPNSEAPSK